MYFGVVSRAAERREKSIFCIMPFSKAVCIFFAQKSVSKKLLLRKSHQIFKRGGSGQILYYVFGKDALI